MNPEVLEAFVVESNRIEGILRPPTKSELSITSWFMKLDVVTIEDLEKFVKTCSPKKYALRVKPGQDVYVGNHRPPPGGPSIGYALGSLLEKVNSGDHHPYPMHVEYETLHPFMDGNGRSGRAIWAWQMTQQLGLSLKLGFLHTWYYQSLDFSREKTP